MTCRLKIARVSDRKYLDSFRDRTCESCDTQDGTIIPAHVRAGEHAGLGRKPDDSLTVALCHRCHMEQEANPGPDWWFEHVFKRYLRTRYAEQTA